MRRGKMNEQDELAQLEAERNRLLSMIAYYQSPNYQGVAGRRPAGPIMVFGFRFYLTDLDWRSFHVSHRASGRRAGSAPTPCRL